MKFYNQAKKKKRYMVLSARVPFSVYKCNFPQDALRAVTKASGEHLIFHSLFIFIHVPCHVFLSVVLVV